MTRFKSDVGGQRCPDSVRNYCAVSVGQNQVQIRNPDTLRPSRLKISDFDWQTRHSKSGQNPDSAVPRRLVQSMILELEVSTKMNWPEIGSSSGHRFICNWRVFYKIALIKPPIDASWENQFDTLSFSLLCIQTLIWIPFIGKINRQIF